MTVTRKRTAGAMIIGALALAGIRCDSADTHGGVAPTRPTDARAFVDTIGVNTHIWYGGTSYENYAMVKRRLSELGIRHIRDSLDPARRRAVLARFKDLGRAGVSSTLIGCRVEPPGVPWSTLVRDAKALRRWLDALEGVNEPDLFGGVPDWSSQARRCQRQMFRQARTKIFGPPLEVPVIGPSTQAGNYEALGDLTGRADAAAIHPYSGGKPPSSPEYDTFTSQMAQARGGQFRGRRVAVYATETGYHDALNTAAAGNPPVSPRVAAIYLPRLFLEYAQAGVKRSFAYELVDERPDPGLADVEQHYGLFTTDWSYKPSAVAVRNLIKLLDSREAGPRKPLRVTLADTADPDGPGPRGAVRHMLLQKANGSYWLALWQDSKVWDEKARTDIANPATPVKVTLGRSMRIKLYRPTTSTAAIGALTGRSGTVDVGDDVVLIQMT